MRLCFSIITTVVSVIGGGKNPYHYVTLFWIDPGASGAGVCALFLTLVLALFGGILNS